MGKFFEFLDAATSEMCETESQDREWQFLAGALTGVFFLHAVVGLAGYLLA